MFVLDFTSHNLQSETIIGRTFDEQLTYVSTFHICRVFLHGLNDLFNELQNIYLTSLQK